MAKFWVPCIMAVGKKFQCTESIINEDTGTDYLRFDVPLPTVDENGNELHIYRSKVVLQDADVNNKITELTLCAIGTTSVQWEMWELVSDTIEYEHEGVYVACLSDQDVSTYYATCLRLAIDTDTVGALDILCVLVEVQYV